jgi:hypothetical protein
MASQIRCLKAAIGSTSATGLRFRQAVDAAHQPFVVKSRLQCSGIGSPRLWPTPRTTLWVRDPVKRRRVVRGTSGFACAHAVPSFPFDGQGSEYVLWNHQRRQPQFEAKPAIDLRLAVDRLLFLWITAHPLDALSIGLQAQFVDTEG